MTVPGWSKVKAAFADWRRERDIRAVLRSLAKQRVVSFDAGHNAWIVKDPLPADDEALNTCVIRGWIEVLPHGAVEKRVADDPRTTKVRIPLHRLTDSG